MIHAIKAFFPAVLLAYLLASVLVTQANLAAIQSLGLDVSIGIRMRTTLQDFIGMATSYLILITVGLALAFPIAAGLARLFPRRRAFLFTLAGFVAIVALHLIMKEVLGLSPVAPTRSALGLLSQGLAGAVGGYFFHLLSRRRVNP